MSLSSSLYAGISGLSTMGNSMSVLGDNVANVNTTAFKSSRATFQDVLSQSVATAAGSAQVGRGVTLTAVDGLFAQGSFESTSTSTDMAIGGEGFFMLRASDSAEAALYTRAGEFRFDTQGYLISPTGHFVQGWGMDSDTGNIKGTIADIYLGSSTPPVATQLMDVIVNVDSRVEKEITEMRLYEAWNGSNLAQANPTDPISANHYDYTTAIKVYDSKGAAHDITIYFDRTTQENQWEYLITCDPGVDRRVLDEREQSIYAPNERFNFENHKGAGALQYGVIDFNTSGAIVGISAWDVPPDGKVEPSQNTNRLTLEPTEGYYSFKTNFTGAEVDQMVQVNFGARFSGVPTNQTQILVSNRGAFADQNFTSRITKETLWSDVHDSDGSAMADGDLITWSGFDQNGNEFSTSYLVKGSNKVSDFLDTFGRSFVGGTAVDVATIDQNGKLRLTDRSGGESPMFVTSFVVTSRNGSDPFGGGEVITNTQAHTATGAVNELGTTINTGDTGLTQITHVTGGTTIAVGHQFVFLGTALNDAAINATFTVGADDTINTLLNYAANLYTNGNGNDPEGLGADAGSVRAVLDSEGRIRILDATSSGKFSNISMTFNDGTPTDANTAQPWGAVNNNTNLLVTGGSTTGQINVNTTKREMISQDRALSTDSGNPPVIKATTTWNSVFASDGSQVANGDQIIFAGTKRDGTPTRYTYDVNTNDGSTVQKMLDGISAAFDADAFIDVAGRLVVRDRISDTANEVSGLTFRVNGYSGSAQVFGAPASSLPMGTPGNLVGAGGPGVAPAIYTDAGGTNAAIGASLLANAYDSQGRAIAAGDKMTFSGTRADGTTVNDTFTVGTIVGTNATMEDLMNWLADRFATSSSPLGSPGEVVPDFNIFSTDPLTDQSGAPIVVGTNLWDINDADGNRIAPGDTFRFTGVDDTGAAVNLGNADFVVGVDGDTVQDLMDWLNAEFDPSDTDLTFSVVDGAIQLTRLAGSPVEVTLNSVTPAASNGALPLGAAGALLGAAPATHTTPNLFSPDAVTALAGTGVNLWDVFDNSGNQIAVGDAFTFVGTDDSGDPVNATFTVGADGDTVQHFLDWLEGTFDPTNSGNFTATLVGQTLQFATTAGAATITNMTYTPATSESASPFGATGSKLAVSNTIAMDQVLRSANGALLNDPTSLLTNITSGGMAIAVGDQLTVSGTDAAGGAVVATTFTVSAAHTLQDLMNFLDTTFDDVSNSLAIALNGTTGRLEFTVSNASPISINLDNSTGGTSLNLSLVSGVINFESNSENLVINLMGTVSASGGGSGFEVIQGDLTEDGSRMGGVVSYDFEREALSSTQYANSSTTIYQDQDGFAAGFLQAVNVDTRGIITGSYSNGQVLQKAKVALANFSNVQGLHKVGGNIFRATTESGAPVTGAPGENGLGSIAPNSLEMSNVDLGTEFVKLITTQRGFQANSKIITTTDEMLNELINIKR